MLTTLFSRYPRYYLLYKRFLTYLSTQIFFVPDNWLHHKELTEIETIQAFGKIEECAQVDADIESGIF